MTSTVYVSCIYDLYPLHQSQQDWERNLQLDFRISKANELLNMQIPIVMYTSSDILPRLIHCNPQALVYDVDLSEFCNFDRIMQQQLSLPVWRNQIKDTQLYYALMNAKLDFVAAAKHIAASDHYTWLDSGITKHTPDLNHMQWHLQNFEPDLEHIVSPTGTPDYDDHTETQFGVIWKFLGTVLKIPDKQFDKFYQACNNQIELRLKQNCTTWEVNIWHMVWRQNPEWFRFYSANHDFSIFTGY